MEVGGTGWWLHGLAGARERVEQDGNENNDRNKRQPNNCTCRGSQSQGRGSSRFVTVTKRRGGTRWMKEKSEGECERDGEYDTLEEHSNEHPLRKRTTGQSCLSLVTAFIKAVAPNIRPLQTQLGILASFLADCLFQSKLGGVGLASKRPKWHMPTFTLVSHSWLLFLVFFFLFHHVIKTQQAEAGLETSLSSLSVPQRGANNHAQRLVYAKGAKALRAELKSQRNRVRAHFLLAAPLAFLPQEVIESTVMNCIHW